MLDGFCGKMLFVDLTKGTWEEKELDEELATNFLGGYGIGAKVLYEMIPAKADPLGPDNVLGFVTGPATATKASFGGRYTVVCKSPVTGGFNDASSGGFFGPEIKKAGYDAIFISGVAKKPVYLWINDGKVEIRDAADLMGKDVKETWEALKVETGEPKVRVACIGPPGEKLSLMSAIMNDGHRAAARGGSGAVMGSKNLKAIAVRGTGTVSVANPEMVTELNKKLVAGMKENPFAQGFGEYGTGVGTGASALSGDSPVKNWKGAGIVDIGEEKANQLAATTFDSKYKTKKYACAQCPLGCGAEYEKTGGRWPLAETERPEYETAASFGCLILNSEEDVIFKANEVCNRAGFDTISAGATIAWAMECYEKGILTKEDLDGIDLTWGNGEATIALLEKMAAGEGCGAVLMNGSAYAAEKLGKGAECLVTASGIELPMHDPRFAPGFTRTYRLDPTPGRHVKHGLGMPQMMGAPIGNKYDYNATGYLDVKLTADGSTSDAAGFCLFLGIVGQGMTGPLLEAITGRTHKSQDIFNTGVRVFTMRHAFNLREGLKPADFDMSDRGKGGLTEGPLAGVEVDTSMLDRNWFAWTGYDPETGIPTLESLKRMGHVEEVIRDFYPEAAGN